MEEVEKLLQRPEDLNRLDALLDEYHAKHQVSLENNFKPALLSSLHHDTQA